MCQASMCPPVTPSRAAGPADVGGVSGRQGRMGAPYHPCVWENMSESRRAVGRRGCICPSLVTDLVLLPPKRSPPEGTPTATAKETPLPS